MIPMLRRKNMVVLWVLVAGLATAQEPGEPVAAIDHVEMYLQEMQADMEAIQGELNPELRHALMRKHMESMAEAMAVLQTEMLPYLQNRVGLHASGNRRIDIGAEPSDSAALSKNGGSSDASIDEAIEMMDEAIVLRQMEAILEQMSKHREVLQETPE